MTNTVYVCRSCGYVFPQELSELIENNVQVYCEMCGSPFSLTGVEFKQDLTRYSKPGSPSNQLYIIKQKNKTKLANAIKIVNKFDCIPILIFVSIVLVLSILHLFNPIYGSFPFVGQIILALAALFIFIYDKRYISPRIQSDGYSSIALDAFCYGILGCIIYGIGVIILIKGILIILYNILYQEEETHKFYNFALKLKNSLNNFSAKAGFIVILLTLFSILIFGIFDNTFAYMIWEYINSIIVGTSIWDLLLKLSIIIIGFSIFPSIILLIDFRLQRKIYDNANLKIGVAIGIFILGVLGSAFFGVGIFIILKAIMLFLLVAGKPIDYQKTIVKKEEVVQSHPRSSQEMMLKEAKKKEFEDLTPILKKDEKIIETKSDLVKETISPKDIARREEPVIKEEIREEPPKTITVEKIESKNELPELKLHESLLPVKNEKDKKVVKEYFSKIFNVLSKELREKIKELDIPKEDRKEILKEVAFLNEIEQQKYIEILKELYSEFPIKLIERIRKLKNVKPQHYEKIIEQLKYMDFNEQLDFVQFLENNP